MKHTKNDIIIGSRSVSLYTETAPEFLLIQCVDSHDMEEMETEISHIEGNTDRKFLLAAVRINKWNDEISPWPAPPVFGKIPFGSGANDTLNFITCELIPDLSQKHGLSRVILGGYSLSGLFSLWCSCQTNAFEGIVAASPSVWFDGWLDYSRANHCLAKRVYLSLGDRENHSKNKLMATVADAIEEQKDILDKQQIANVLVWNQGNHFQDNGERTAKGFVWNLNLVQ